MISNNVMREFGAYRNYLSICSGYFKKKWSKNMDIFVENDFAYGEEEALAILANNCGEIAECTTDKTGTVSIIKQDKQLFELSTGGGKVRSVIDRRK